jgi:hypothetical protein
MGDDDRAAECWTTALHLARTTSWAKLIADALTNLIMFEKEGGELLRVLGPLVDWYGASGFGQERFDLLSAVRVAHLRHRHFDEARQLLESAHEGHVGNSMTVSAVYDLLNLVDVEIESGALEAGLDRALQAVGEVERLGLVDLIWAAYRAVARSYLARLGAGYGV